jgi:hypothetical protein
MAASARFRALRARVLDLERRLVPKTKISGKYTAHERDLLRAFRLLVHAEFEAYFEDRVTEIADCALRTFTTRNRAGRALAALMTYSPVATPELPKSLASTTPSNNPSARVRRIIGHFKTEVNQGNHGIKERNVIKMCFPVGIEQADLDPTFMNTLNSYATSRGATAHQSFKAQQPIDPVTEVAVVSGLVIELEKLDVKFQMLRKV